MIFVVTQLFIWTYVGYKIGYSEGRYTGQARIVDSYRQARESASKAGWLFPDIESDFHPLTKHVLKSIYNETEMWEQGNCQLYYPYDVEYEHKADFKLWTANSITNRRITEPEEIDIPMKERRALHYAYLWWKKNVKREKRELVESLS